MIEIELTKRVKIPSTNLECANLVCETCDFRRVVKSGEYCQFARFLRGE